MKSVARKLIKRREMVIGGVSLAGLAASGTSRAQVTTQQPKTQRSSTTLETARRAFEHFTHGWATGDFQPDIDIKLTVMQSMLTAHD